MKKSFLVFLILSSYLAWGNACVLVSIAPQKFLVEEIGGEHVNVKVIVPTGTSAHTYEPTPKQLIALKEGVIWFRLGESFEDRLIDILSHILIVDQREGIELIKGSCCCGTGADPHTWLSPRLLKIQVKQIAETLCKYDSTHAHIYQENLAKIENKLVNLDEKMAMQLANAPKTILVAHSAFGYLCRDYGLTQLSVEMEGRAPTSRYLTDLILKARTLRIQTVFLQRQQSVKGGKRIAKTIGARCVYLNPYAENVIENLKEIAGAFCQ